jgi:hypothetical protein
MSSLYSAVTDLQATWHTLRDLERARAIRPIIRAGVSRRQLSTALNVSEGTLRNLLLTLEADPEDQDLFHRGVISRRELTRCQGNPPSRRSREPRVRIGHSNAGSRRGH